MRHLSDAQAAHILKETFPDRPSFSLGSLVGTGGQGTVWELHGAAQPAVCKMISTEPPEELGLSADAAKRYREVMAQNAKRELESLTRFSCSRHFPTLIGHRVYMAGSGTGAQVYIFIEEELIPLLPIAYTELNLSPRELAIRVGLEVSDALCEMLRQKRTHRDIKIPNLFFRINNDGSYEVVLSDFGASKEAVPGSIETVIGSPGDIPPERLHRRVCYTAMGKGDVYSLGITLLEILSSKDLYIPEEALLANEIAQRLELVKTQDPALGRLIANMIRQQPFFRPSPAECLQEFRKLLPTPNVEQHKNIARRALAAFQQGHWDEARRLAVRLPADDARRYLLLALISGSSSERLFNLRYAARLGSPSACYYVAEALLSGKSGVKCDPELSLQYLRCAATANYTPAVYRLHCLQTGKTLQQDTPENRIASLMEEIAS